MPSLLSATLTKTKTATLTLSIAIAIFLLMYTTYKRLIYSPRNFLLLLLNLVVFTLFLLHRANAKYTKQAPIFSFPSLSQPLVSFPSISLSQPLFSFRSLSQPLQSLPSLSLKARFGAPPKKSFAPPDPVIASPPPPPPRKPDVVILDNVSYQDRIIIADVEPPDEEGDKSLDDTWNAIMASGSAKPVKMKKSETSERTLDRADPKKEVKKSMVARRRKQKRTKKVDERVEGWRQRDRLVMPHDELFQRVEAFIKEQYDHLKLQREESNQRRLLERQRVGKNAF